MSKKITLLALLGATVLGGAAFAFQKTGNVIPSSTPEVQVCSEPAITPYNDPNRVELYANAPVRKSESPDSASVTINVTYDSGIKGLTYLLLMPKFDLNVVGYVSQTKANTYNMTVGKGNYELLIVCENQNNQGQTFWYRDNINANNDVTIDVNTEDCNILTAHKIILPDGKEAKQDFYCTKTKEVIDTGNIRHNCETYMSMDLPHRLYSHLNHYSYYLMNQYYADPTVIINTWHNPWCRTNTKNLPLVLTYDYSLRGSDGQYGISFKVNSNNYGDTITTPLSKWQTLQLKWKDIICDTVPADYNPSLYTGNGNGLHWIDGEMINSSTGAGAALPSDPRLRYHLNFESVNGTNKGSDYALFTGLPVTKLGTQYHGMNPLPVTVGQNGIEFLPVQYLYPGLKIWAGSNGSTFYIYDNKNPRLNADAETVWGEGFPYASFYPAVKVSATINPRFDIAMKGNNGEQRAYDVVNSSFKTYKYNDTTSTWKEIWTGNFTQITQIQTSFKNNGLGLFAAEVVDTGYQISGVRGRSTSRVELTNGQDDPNPPVINMLNVRDASDRIVEKLATTEGATVELYAADLTYNLVKIYGYTMGDVKNAKVECAPYGSDNFKTLPVVEHPERKLELFWGKNYVADLSAMNVKSENGLYDLRVTVEDPSGNKAIVHASPAFYASKLAAVEAITPEDQLDVIVADGTISVPGMPEAAINVYDMSGRMVASGRGTIDATALAPAVYVVKVNDNNVSAVKKVLIK